MAKFVLAGKADCPYYAKAELLADLLERSLPNFRIHKISIHPRDWKEWLESTCKTNAWKHEQSPIIWRELIDRGGKGMLLGGFSDFLEHVQGYYGITSDMSTELMLKVAAENLRTRELCEEEEVHSSLIAPLHIWISSALNQTCYILVPMLFTPGVFPEAPPISLHLLDVGGDEEEMQGLRMEIEDLALPQLHQVTGHTDLDQAFQQAHVIILLDDSWSDGEEEESTARKVADRYRGYGQLIEQRAHENVVAIVAGDSLVSLKCSLLLENAPSIDSSRFVVMATQLEYEARAHIAKKLNVKTADVSDVIVWGNISGISQVDLQRAKVFNYQGAICGPSHLPQPVLEMIYERKWLESEFENLVNLQRGTVASKTQRPTAISATNGIIAVLKALNGKTSTEEVLSLGILSTGQFNIPTGIVFSMPVRFGNGQWSVLSDVTIGDKLMARMQISADQLKTEKDLATRTIKSMT
ncbi:putative malate dehydrogenase 1B [Osmerus mordax]|uniref:putative malate dehydrogenase 1B n=1 Tax=Osmerus mordax TaxID=8014 RepID=UPI0035106F8F